ncbi:hypothetical protein GOP47_0010355 [Adiantum capillus-veneris]|uniref:Nucleoside phosphorylase domain-containing protein n=1 Tax=Adiantum capillus-veneris TaxID=13818 RepID=A0A9D4ZGB5_ADICA|nr:hypothetical protein GOP47_0010355 [Adiantum capillus-veneris]
MALMTGVQVLIVLSLYAVCHLSLVEAMARRELLQKLVARVNAEGPYVGIVVPNSYEMSPLLNSSIFTPYSTSPIDLSGRRFYIGTIESHKVIIVMTGLSMLNAGITTQTLLDYFDISGIVHYGIAGNTNDNLHIGDITIPKYWAHTGLWNWQRYEDGPDDELSLEENGDFTREIGYIHFGNYNNPPKKRDNYLNNVWFQPEEVFPVTGTPEVREHHFWVPVDKTYLKIAKQIKDIELVSCVNASFCLQTPPKVVIVERGVSSNIFLDNAAYRGFLRKKFNISPIDMESASVALVSLTNNVPFIAIRALSDLAGGSSNENEASIFASLAATNAVIVMTNFIKNI